MVRRIVVLGAKGNVSIEDIVDSCRSKGGDAVVLDHMQVFCPEQVLSAAEHAERAFERGTNRSRSFPTELIVYASGERQVSRAIELMRPKAGADGFVVVFIDMDDIDLARMGLVECPELLDQTTEKAKAMGLDRKGMNVRYCDLALERVAMLDVEKL